MARGRETMVDEQARDLSELASDQAQQLFAGEAANDAPVPDNSPGGLDLPAMQTQMSQLLKMYIDAGMMQQRPDGSLVLPGQGLSEQQQLRKRLGSACTCHQCTKHNQRHWICVICGNAFEWVIRQPKAQWSHLGPAGRAGRLDAACTDACAREYLQGVGRAQGQNTMPINAMIPAVPANDAEGFGMLMSEGLA